MKIEHALQLRQTYAQFPHNTEMRTIMGHTHHRGGTTNGELRHLGSADPMVPKEGESGFTYLSSLFSVFLAFSVVNDLFSLSRGGFMTCRLTVLPLLFLTDGSAPRT